MYKKSQERSFLNKVKEVVNAPGEKLTGVFSPEFVKIMDEIRVADNETRELAAGLKDLLKTSQSYFNRREYLSSLSNLGKFNEICEVIQNKFSKISSEIQVMHNEFLFNALDEEHKSNLMSMLEKRKSKKINKKAGLADWWHNLTNDNAKVMKLWEKKFPKVAKDIKKDIEIMLGNSEKYLSFLLKTFESLAKSRASRDIEGYLKEILALKSKFMSYDQSFDTVFKRTFSQLIESQKQMDLSKIKELSDSIDEDIENKKIMDQKQKSNDLVEKPAPNKNKPLPSFPEKKQEPIKEESKTQEEEKPNQADIEKQLKTEKELSEKTNDTVFRKELKFKNEDQLNEKADQFVLEKEKKIASFLASLDSLKDKNPKVMAKEIIRFALELQDEKMKESLLKIAKSLVIG